MRARLDDTLRFRLKPLVTLYVKLIHVDAAQLPEAIGKHDMTGHPEFLNRIPLKRGHLQQPVSHQLRKKARQPARLYPGTGYDVAVLIFRAQLGGQPASGRGFMWKAGVGLLNYRAEDQQDAFSTNALGFQLGTGYVIPVKGRFSATPYVTVFLAPLGGEVKFNSATIVEKASLSLLQFGVGVIRR